jgi:hypothetical protein
MLVQLGYAAGEEKEKREFKFASRKRYEFILKYVNFFSLEFLERRIGISSLHCALTHLLSWYTSRNGRRVSPRSGLSPRDIFGPAKLRLPDLPHAASPSLQSVQLPPGNSFAGFQRLGYMQSDPEPISTQANGTSTGTPEKAYGFATLNIASLTWMLFCGEPSLKHRGLQLAYRGKHLASSTHQKSYMNALVQESIVQASRFSVHVHHKYRPPVYSK